ncbi:hypothetical protein E2R16_15465 [Acinetobacter seifertii]|uniref:Uncharacterized protein n=1 Tax=Acinetobacter seifertii TaxID=1530123 RepID=A0A5E9PC28_9GAMM|nr:hypothetical protein [Acinetobacter seifertii]TEU25962.1 hypothetical protein E2R16_15465 [Acinetobacter seifertii]
MAFLIEGYNLDDEISLDMFYPESFRSLDELIVIHEENLIVIKENWCGKICDTFFNLHTLERIDPFKRYNQENGKAIIERIDDLTVITTVSIEKETMAEYLLGAVFRNDQQIFKSFDVRYFSLPTQSTYQKYLSVQTNLRVMQKSREDFFKDFVHSSFEEKISKLRQIFRTNFRANCEIGYYPAEYFLPQELFESLDNDSQFRTALLEVLRLEESATNEPASVVFDNLIKHYVLCKEA